MAEIRFVSDFAPWLKGRTQTECAIFAVRAAIRTLPILWRAIEYEHRPSSVASRLALSFFRAAAVSWLASQLPTSDEEKAKFGIASSVAFSGATEASFGFPAVGHLLDVLDAITAAGRTASSLGNEQAASAAFDAIDAASRAAGSSTATSAAFAPAALAASIADAAAIEGGTTPSELADSPLWPSEEVPDGPREGWHNLTSYLIAEGDHWRVWADWYEGLLAGRPPQVNTVELARVMLDDSFWWRGPATVNREMLRLVEEAKGKRSISEANGRDFFVSYSTVDEAVAREVADVLESSGYSTFAQFKDFGPGANFVSEMQRGLSAAGRIIVLYSPEYQASGHCQAEWNAAYNSDPSGKNRKLLPFLLRPTELSPLARQIVYVSLVGLDKEARRERILEAIRYVSPTRSKSEVVQALAMVASPDVTVSEGRLDASANSTFDRPFLDSDLAMLPALQRSVADAIVEALPYNSPRVIRSSLTIYAAELRDRGAQPIVGILQQHAGALEAEYRSQDADLWGAGLASLFGSFFANNQLLLTHFPLREDRERLFSETPVDEASANGQALTKPTSEVAKAVDAVVDIDKATADFQKVNESIHQMAKDIGSLPPTARDQDQSGAVITPKRRFVLTTLGFYERIYAFIGSTASIASTPQGMALAEKLKSAIDAFLRLLL